MLWGNAKLIGISAVSIPAAAVEPIRRVQLPGIRKEADEGCIPGTPRRDGREKGAGAAAEGIEGVAGIEGERLQSMMELEFVKAQMWVEASRLI
jgi:hypothetical protein